MSDRLSQANLPFHALEFVRSDHGIWAHEHNAASLPLGCLSSTTWIRRLHSVSIVRPFDACNPWTWKGRTMSNSVLVRFHVAEEGNDAGFDVRGQDVHLNSQPHVGHEDLGELLPHWTIALKLYWEQLLMMLGECGRSLMSTTFLNVKLDRMVNPHHSGYARICHS